MQQKNKNILPKPKKGQQYVEKEFINDTLVAERTIEYLGQTGVDYVFTVAKGEKGTACYTAANWLKKFSYEINRRQIITITLEPVKP